MATIEQVETLLKDVLARIEALPQALTEDQIKGILSAHMETLLADESSDLYRKMRFGKADPKLVGSKFARWNLSVADVEFLYDLQSALVGERKVAGGGVYQGPSAELQNAFKAISEAYYLDADEVRKIDRTAIDDLFPRVSKASLKQYEAALKAMDSAEAGFGQQLIGAQYVGELWESARRDSRVFNLIESFEMQHPTAYLPVEVDIPEMLFVSESSANNSANYATVKTGSQRVQVDARKFVIHQMWSGELEEDSIIPFVPFLRRQAALSIAHYSDSLVLNGDATNAPTGNINLVDADPADTKHYLAFDGIRHVGLVDNVANSRNAAGGVSYALLRSSFGRMIDAARFVDWGHPTNPQDVVYVADPDTADRIAELDEVLTVDRYGAQATVITGELAKIGQNPLIPSIAMSKTNATGNVSNTPANNTLGQVVCFNRRGFKVGWRRRVKLETERLPATDQTRLVYSLRMGFGRFTPTGAASGIEAADVIYNITV